MRIFRHVIDCCLFRRKSLILAMEVFIEVHHRRWQYLESLLAQNLDVLRPKSWRRNIPIAAAKVICAMMDRNYRTIMWYCSSVPSFQQSLAGCFFTVPKFPCSRQVINLLCLLWLCSFLVKKTPQIFIIREINYFNSKSAFFSIRLDVSIENQTMRIYND